jgi:hypothetical protein
MILAGLLGQDCRLRHNERISLSTGRDGNPREFFPPGNHEEL